MSAMSILLYDTTISSAICGSGVVPINRSRFENAYSSFLKTFFRALNPLKKKIIKTECQVHKQINQHALIILKNDRYDRQYAFYMKYLEALNEGTVWADQDFKSSNHFYNPYQKKRGLYGRSNAMALTVDYYLKAVLLWKKGKIRESMFFLGAALHLIQDVTIPQHVNVRLLDDHRQFENFVKRTYQYTHTFRALQGAYVLSTIENYVKFNSRTALKIYRRFRNVKNDESRYYRIARCTLPLAKRTTAGAMVLFYNKVVQRKEC